MGTLLGHVGPGFFFLVAGIWWSFRILQRFFVCRKEADFSGTRYRKNNPIKFRSSLLFPCCCCKRLPMEAICILLVTIIGIIGELATAFRGGKFVNIGNGQHIVMYFFYSLMALADIAQHYRWSVPPSLEYCMGLLGVAIEGFLFSNHLHGRLPMDVQLHTFLLYVIFGLFVSGGLEMVYRSKPMPAIARAYFTAVHGSWFIHVGFILYPPPGMGSWNQESQYQMMLVIILFTSHFAVMAIIFAIIGAFLSCRVTAMSRNAVYQSLDSNGAGSGSPNGAMGLTSSKMNNEQMRNIISESEDEV